MFLHLFKHVPYVVVLFSTKGDLFFFSNVPFFYARPAHRVTWTPSVFSPIFESRVNLKMKHLNISITTTAVSKMVYSHLHHTADFEL